MSLYLYDKTSTSFNNEGLGVLLDFVDEPEVIENINGFFELTFTYALGGHLADYLTEEMYISTQTNEHDDEYLVFRIYESEPDYVDGSVIIRARLKQTDDFMNSIVKARTLLKGDIGFQVKSLMANATPTLNYRVGGTINGVLDIEREDDNIYNILFDDNGLFTLNGVTPKFTPEGITITKGRAWSTSSVITEKNFIEQLTINTSRRDMVTQIIPFTETRRDVLTPNEDSKYHKRETIEEKVYGTPVISPKVANMSYPVITRFMEFRNDVKEELKMDETEYNTYLYESVDDLNEKAKTFFTDNEGIDEYEVEVSIETLGLHMDDYEQISSLGLYDIVEIYLEEYGVNVPVQVMEVTYSPLIGRNTQLKLTSKLNRIEHASNRINSNAPSEQQLREFIQNQIINNKINETVHNFIIKDDGTKISYVNQLPPVETAIEGDVVFLVTEEGGSIWEFVNGAWVEVLPLNFEQYVTDQLTEVFNQFDTERTETEQAINEAMESAKAEAERLDNERQTLIDGQISDVISQAEADKTETSNAIDKAKAEAIAEAERLNSEVYKYYDTTLLTTIWYRGESPDMQRISGQKNLVGLLVETAQISKEQANKAYLDAVAEAESKVQAKDAEYQSVFDTYDLALTRATQDIQTSLSKADDALEEAGISTDIAGTAKGLAEQAKQAADEAKRGAEQAKLESEQAKEEVATIPTKINDFITTKGLVDGNFVEEKVDEATGAWSLELAKVESLVLPETFTVLTATWLRGESPQMNLSQIKNKIPQRGHVLYGAFWTKGHDPIMKRTTGEQALSESVSIFGAEYKRDVEGIYHELTRVESNIPSLDGYATQYWANNRFETAQSVSQKLSAYTNTEILNSLLADKANLSDIPSLSGYAKESWVENKNYQTASEINQTLTSYTKTTELNSALAHKADITDIPDISGKADKTELEPYAKTQWVQNQNYQTADMIKQTLSSYTQTTLNPALLNKANLDDIPDISGKADKSEIPSLSGYAKESWVTNQNYQTASDVTQTLTNYAKVSDLTGMVTESTLATKNYVTAGKMSTTLTDYLKTTDLNNEIQETTAFQDVKETTNRFTRVIGSTDAEAKTNIAQIAMTDQIFQTSVNDILDNKGYITDTTLTMSATWIKGADPVMQRTSKLEELIRLANSAQSGVEEINQNIKLESIMGMTWFKRPSPRMQPINKLDALNSAVSSAHSKITQLSDMIDLRVTADGLIGAINLQAGKTIFQQGTNKLMLTTDTFYMPDATIESAHIKNINASKIYGTSADFNNVRAGVLVADAVKSTHIEASTTLIDKLFATSALIGELTSKTAFIDSIKAVEIDASKIKSGTIDSARINVTDLRTKLLTANVIESTHIKADEALFTKLFTDDLATEKLATKTAWITNAMVSNLDASKITSGTISTARLDAKSIVTNGLQANVVKSTHILADNALFEKLFTNDLATEKLATKQAWIKSSMIGNAQIGTAQIGQIDAGTGKIVNIDAQYITANHASLVSAGFQGLNSNMHIDGGAIRIQNTAGDFATMNAIPEFRSQDSAGTSAILGKGRSQYYSGNQSRFYIGSSLNGDEYNGSAVHGVHISKGQTWGIYRQSDAFGGTPAQYFKTPAGWGAVNVVEELMRTGKIVNNFTQASALIRSLNGWGNSWPVLQPGDMVMYKAAVPGNSSGIERIWTMGTSSNGDTRTYSHVHHVFEGGTTGVSDERLKHDIKPTGIKALDHIADLSFKQFRWNRNDELEPLGLIAQESGILRVPDAEVEGIDLQRAMMLALKGIQELSQKVQEMGA